MPSEIAHNGSAATTQARTSRNCAKPIQDGCCDGIAIHTHTIFSTHGVKMGVASGTYDVLATTGRVQGWVQLACIVLFSLSMTAILAFVMLKPQQPGEAPKDETFVKVVLPGMVMLSAFVSLAACWASLMHKSKPLAAAAGGATILDAVLPDWG